MPRIVVFFIMVVSLLSQVMPAIAAPGNIDEIRQYFELRDTISLMNLEMKRALAPDMRPSMFSEAGAENKLNSFMQFMERRIQQLSQSDTPLKYHYVKKLSNLFNESRQLYSSVVVRIRTNAVAQRPGNLVTANSADSEPAKQVASLTEANLRPRPYFHPIDLRTLATTEPVKPVKTPVKLLEKTPVKTGEPAKPLKPVEVAKPVKIEKPLIVATAVDVKPVESVKPMENVKPVEAVKPAEAVKPVIVANAVDVKPVDPVKPIEAAKPVVAVKPVEAIKPVIVATAVDVKPVDPVKPIEAVKPVEEIKPVEPVKPIETVKPVEPVKPVEIEAKLEPVIPPGTGSMRPLAIMIENHNQSRPQSGLDQADLLYEMPVEGGITRFMAVYTRLPGLLGPVRSCREYFIDRAIEVNALYVHCGGSPNGYNYISKSKINSIDEIQNGPPFFRDKNRKAPHNLYSKGQSLYDYMSEKISMRLATQPVLLNYGTKTRQATELGNSVKIKYHGNYTLEVKFENGAYQRYMNDVLHIDRETEKPLQASAVVVQVASMKTIDKIGRQEISFIGSGTAWILENGGMTAVTWHKDTVRALTSYKDAAGEEYCFPTGLPVWVQVVSPMHKLVFNGVEPKSSIAETGGNKTATETEKIGKQG